jgi:hypothetical protein
MNAADVAVATITWARTADEAQVLARSLSRLADAVLRVAVADRATSPALSALLDGLPGFRTTVPSEEGLVPQVKASLQLAASFERPFILYTEPDKERFFAAGLQPFLREAPAADDVGVVLAARSPGSFRTFPPMQQYTEGVINQLCGDTIAGPGDYAYGPFLMNRRLLPCVARIHGRVQWGWRPWLFRAARRLGLRVLHLVGDHPCPEDQRVEDEAERQHRMLQLSQNILGLVD